MRELALSFAHGMVDNTSIMTAPLHRLSVIRACCLLWLSLSSFLATASARANVEVWLTDPDHSVLFKKQAQLLPLKAGNNDTTNVIHVAESRSYQSIDGFGYTLTGGSATHLIHMSPSARAGLLHELFATDRTNIGVSYLRVSIGASDLNEHVFSYDDLPPGQPIPR